MATNHKVLATGDPVTNDPALPNRMMEDSDSMVFLPIITTPPPPPNLAIVPFATTIPESVTITAITHANDDRLFVANREGRIYIVLPNGTTLPQMFLEVPNVYHDGFENGLLGLAFHPDYPATPYFYVAYTGFRDIYVARGQVDPNNPNKALPNVVKMIEIPKPKIDPEGEDSPYSSVHNAGDLKFGPDGYLYIPIGDGGPDPYDRPDLPGDPNNHSQRRDVLLGSILRIDPDPNRGLPPDCGVKNNRYYSIPPSNPWLFDSGCDELWVKGLRNPWRISFDRLNGDLYIADVGEWEFEEVNYLPANMGGGTNFGWHCWEGTFDYHQPDSWPVVGEHCDYQGTQFTFPVHEYPHHLGRCSITGGYVYRGNAYPLLYGRYVFADWCSGEAWTMDRFTGQWQATPANNNRISFTTFGEDKHGELYAGAWQNGTIYKVVVAP